MSVERKWIRVLRALVERHSLHRLEAERVALPDYDGGVVRVDQYRNENREQARRLLQI